MARTIRDTGVLIGFSPEGTCVYSDLVPLGNYWDGEHVWDSSEQVCKLRLAILEAICSTPPASCSKNSRAVSIWTPASFLEVGRSMRTARIKNIASSGRSTFTVCQPPNKQVQRTVIRRCGRGGARPLNCGVGPGGICEDGILHVRGCQVHCLVRTKASRRLPLCSVPKVLGALFSRN
jgi:hypothetical protein